MLKLENGGDTSPQIANMPPPSPEAVLLASLLVVLDRRDAEKGKRGRTMIPLLAEMRAAMALPLSQQSAAMSRAIAGAYAIAQAVETRGRK